MVELQKKNNAAVLSSKPKQDALHSKNYFIHSWLLSLASEQKEALA